MEAEKHTCIICEKEKENGIFLLQSFVCIECERDIVQTETNSPLYRFYVQQMKKVTKTKVESTSA